MGAVKKMKRNPNSNHGKRKITKGRLRDGSLLTTVGMTSLAKGLSLLHGTQQFASGHKLPRSLFLLNDERPDIGPSEIAHVTDQMTTNERAIPGRFDELRTYGGRKQTIILLPRLNIVTRRGFWKKNISGIPGDVRPNDVEEITHLLFDTFTTARRVERPILPLGDFQFVRLTDPLDPGGGEKLYLIVLDHSPSSLPPYREKGMEAFTKKVLGKGENQQNFFRRVLESAGAGR